MTIIIIDFKQAFFLTKKYLSAFMHFILNVTLVTVDSQSYQFVINQSSKRKYNLLIQLDKLMFRLI